MTRGRKNQKQRLSKEVRQRIVEAYLSSKRPKVHLWRELTGRSTEEHGQILRWMRQLGYLQRRVGEKPIVLLSMSKKQTPSNIKSSTKALEDKIKQLEKKLEDSQLTAEAYRRMIQVAEQEMKIDIQKKSTTK